MAHLLSISEFDHIARDVGNQSILAPMVPSVAEQSVEIGMRPKQSEPFQARFICVYAPVDFALAFGEEPEANPEEHNRPAGVHWYGVNVGHKLSVVAI
jgi:hypothetical protein